MQPSKLCFLDVTLFHWVLLGLIILAHCRAVQIVVAGLGGSGDREREWEENFQPKDVFDFLVFLHYIRLKME